MFIFLNSYIIPVFKYLTSVLSHDTYKDDSRILTRMITRIQRQFTVFCIYLNRHKAFAVSRNLGELGVEKRTPILPGDASSNIVEEPFKPSARASSEDFTKVTYNFLGLYSKIYLLCNGWL